MAEFESGTDARNLIVTGEIDPTAADAGDDADPETLRQLIPLEIARIARSLGHRVTVVANEEPPARWMGDAASTEFPWMHGVTWETATQSEPADDVLDEQQLAVISLAGWIPSLGMVRGDIDDPVVQSMTTLAEALAETGTERIVFVDVEGGVEDETAENAGGDGMASPVAELRRNTRDQIASILRDQSAFGPEGTEVSFVVGRGPVWTQRERLMAAEDEATLDALLSEGEAKTDDDEAGDRVEAVAIAALRTALDAEYRPRVDGEAIVELGHAVFVGSGE